GDEIRQTGGVGAEDDLSRRQLAGMGRAQKVSDFNAFRGGIYDRNRGPGKIDIDAGNEQKQRNECKKPAERERRHKSYTGQRSFPYNAGIANVRRAEAV